MTEVVLLSNRLLKVERRLRRMTRAALILGFLMGAGILRAQLGPQDLNQLDPLRTLRRPDQAAATPTLVEAEVRSRHFVLVDANGKERASLVADDAGSAFLVMFDTRGKTRANLSVTNDGPSLVFYDLSGHARTIIGSTTLVGSHVNDNGLAEKAPASSVVLFDKNGKLLWREP